MALDLGFEQDAIDAGRAVVIDGEGGVDGPEKMHVEVVITCAEAQGRQSGGWRLPCNWRLKRRLIDCGSSCSDPSMNLRRFHASSTVLAGQSVGISGGCLKSPDSRQILSSMCSLQLPESWMKPVPRSVNLALAGLFKHPLRRRRSLLEAAIDSVRVPRLTRFQPNDGQWWE